MLDIQGLRVRVKDSDKDILKGLNLTVKAGEVHAIMGPNGSGKSTLSKVLVGHPEYEVVEGKVLFEINGKKKDLFALPTHERACAGLFLAFQYPVEVPGVTNSVFLRAAFNAVCAYNGAEEMDVMDFDAFVQKKAAFVNMDPKFLSRPLNVDFSGGEKKRNEILQMAVLSPRLAILDETDSGLDVDSLRVVSDGINKLRQPHNAMVLITHYQRLLNHVVPDYVHILSDGQIVESGDKSLALAIEEKGYDWLEA